MVPEPTLVERFRQDLDALIAPDLRIGLAVSGGPDSLAMLLLAAAARPGCVECASVDHSFRPESRSEAEMVGTVCARLGVPHEIMKVGWHDPPATAIQERARNERYRLLGFWAEERGLRALVTAHHADDQAETFLMRLSRGSGVHGLSGMRPRSVAPGTEIRLLRPLLAWRRDELENVCAAANLTPAIDPSNADSRFERVRVRNALADSQLLDAEAIARSAAHLRDADAALDWAARAEWSRIVRERHGAISFSPGDVPGEILRRVVSRAVRKLGTEGAPILRGPELDRLLATLREAGTSTLRGVLCQGGPEWLFSRAPTRRT